MGIWLIIYQVSAANRGEYLEWFHGEHIPEKLARPGYDWAAHYASDQSLEGAEPLTCVALFGSQASRTFYDPSPAQLKPKQDELTRKMIGFRENVRMMILSEEWASSDTAAKLPDHPFLHVQVFAADQADQGIGAWCAQEQFPQLQSDAGCGYATKLIASTGSERHVVLQFRTQETDIEEFGQNMGSGESALEMPRLDLELQVGRIWPKTV